MKHPQIIQINPLPTGGDAVAPINGTLRGVVNQVVDHYTEHSGRGGYVGIVPVVGGHAVQLYSADGTVESYTVYKRV